MQNKQLKKLYITSFLICAFLSIFLLGSQSEAVKANYIENSLHLNEICHNFSVKAAPDEQFYNYIELYNPSDKALNLTGYSLSNSSTASSQYTINNIQIPANGYSIIYATDELTDSNSFFATSDLCDGKTTLYLFDPKHILIDTVHIPVLKYNTSFSRSTESGNMWKYTTPTPSTDNTTAALLIPESLSVPRLSVKSGFYSEPFNLEIYPSNHDTDIYYTLDGSDPSPDSCLYQTPIAITDCSLQKNVYASRTDISAGFFEDNERYSVPDYPVDKAAIIRAAEFSHDGTQKSPITTATYFIGYDQKNYLSLPIISLVSDPDNFFDYTSGIYVAGTTYDEFINNNERESMDNPDNWMRWKANYTNRGREWERPVHIDYFDGNRMLIMSQDAGIRIKGGATRAFTQKSLNLYARKIYSKNSTFSPAFFGTHGTKDITLFSGANDYKTKIRDVLINNVCADLNFSTVKSIPCYVFLDGEYWGIYHITEKFGSDYVEENFGVPKDDVELLKNVGYRADAELDTLVTQSNFEISKDYELLCNSIDMQSFIQYYATEIYIARCRDWPDMNEALWRSKSITTQPYQDHRWRWMLFDLNWTSSCLSDSLTDTDTFEHVIEKSPLFYKVMSNPEFRKDFVINFCDISNTCFSDTVIIPELERLTDIMYQPMLADFKRFYGDNRTEDDYVKEISDLRAFLTKRKPYIMNYLKEHFQLQGTLENLSLTVNQPQNGTVMVNSIHPDLQNGTWIGSYFTDYPITLSAIPNENCHFVRWEGDITSEEASITCTLKTDRTFQVFAIFEPN